MLSDEEFPLGSEERTAFFFGDSEPIDCYRFDAVIFTGVIGIFTMDGITARRRDVKKQPH